MKYIFTLINRFNNISHNWEGEKPTQGMRSTHTKIPMMRMEAEQFQDMIERGVYETLGSSGQMLYKVQVL